MFSPPWARGQRPHVLAAIFHQPHSCSSGLHMEQNWGPLPPPNWAPLTLLSCGDGARGRALGRDVTEGTEPPPAGQTKALLILHAASRCAALQPSSIQRRWSPSTPPPEYLPNLLYAPKTHGRVFLQAKPDAHPAPSPPCTPDPNSLRGHCSAAAPPCSQTPPVPAAGRAPKHREAGIQANTFVN